MKLVLDFSSVLYLTFFISCPFPYSFLSYISPCSSFYSFLHLSPHRCSPVFCGPHQIFLRLGLSLHSILPPRSCGIVPFYNIPTCISWPLVPYLRTLCRWSFPKVLLLLLVIPSRLHSSLRILNVPVNRSYCTPWPCTGPSSLCSASLAHCTPLVFDHGGLPILWVIKIHKRYLDLRFQVYSIGSQSRLVVTLHRFQKFIPLRFAPFFPKSPLWNPHLTCPKSPFFTLCVIFRCRSKLSTSTNQAFRHWLRI